MLVLRPPAGNHSVEGTAEGQKHEQKHKKCAVGLVGALAVLICVCCCHLVLFNVCKLLIVLFIAGFLA